MTTQKLLKMIARDAFGDQFQQELCKIYQRDVDAGEYEAEEAEYAAAKTFLPGILTEHKQKLLQEYESTCVQIRRFSASYGFQAGLLCGFKQYFTNDCAMDGGFGKHVDSEITMMPNMQKHYINYANIDKRNQIYAALSEGESQEVQLHLVSLSCAWSQRERSASINGFYCGYRGAMEIIDQVMPLGCGSVSITSKILTMEHQLGYIKSYAQIERQREEEE